MKKSIDTQMAEVKTDVNWMKDEVKAHGVKIDALPGKMTLMIKEILTALSEESKESHKMILELTDVRIKKIEEINEKTDKKIYKIENKIDEVENFKWQSIGFLTAFSLIIGYAIKVFL
jgi:predicted esterase YcpF (UPF0227 family)